MEPDSFSVDIDRLSAEAERFAPLVEDVEEVRTIIDSAFHALAGWAGDPALSAAVRTAAESITDVLETKSRMLGEAKHAVRITARNYAEANGASRPSLDPSAS